MIVVRILKWKAQKSLLVFTLLFFLFSIINGRASGTGISFPFTLKHYTDAEGLPQNTIRAIGADEAGFIWLGTENGLVRFDGRNFKIYNSKNLAIATSQIMGIQRSAVSNILYARTRQHEIIQISNGHATLVSSVALTAEAILQSKKDSWGIKSLGSRWHYRNSSSGEHFFYENKILSTVEIGPDGYSRLTPLLSGFDLDKNFIVAVYYDKFNQKIYLGSITKGFFIFSHKKFDVWEADDPISEDAYYSQMPFGKDGVLSANGIYFSTTAPPVVFPLIRKLSDSRNILTDHNGHIWTRTWRNLYEITPDGKKLIKKYTLNNNILCLYHAADSTLWIGIEKNGLYYLREGSDTLVPVPNTQTLANINYIMSLSAGTLLIGTDKGLFKLETASGKLTLKSIPVSIKSIQPGRQAGTFWVTSYTQGVALYKNDQLTWMPLDARKWLSPAHCVVEDAYGYCWISTDKGLFQAGAKDLLGYAAGKADNIYYHYYSKDAGFKTNEFDGSCQPCGVQLPNGRISFPSLNGIIHFSPENIRPNMPDKQLFIDNIRINDSTLSSPVDDSVTTPTGLKRFTLRVTTPFFGNSANLHIEYRLQGFDPGHKWSLLEETGNITYTSLPPGLYTLQIRKTNGFGAGNYSYKYFTINVPPYFYQTTWFLALCLLAAALCIFLFIRWRMRKLNRQNNILEQKVSERTSELQQTVSALILSEEKIRNHASLQEQINNSISHDIISPMNFLTRLAGQLFRNRDTLQPDSKETVALIYNTSLEVFNYTNNLSKYIKTQMGHDNAGDIEHIPFHDFMEEQVNKFKALARQHNNEVISTINSSLYLKADKFLLQIIVHNLLDNANKYTSNGTITIAAAIQEHQLYLVVSDTGSGMPDAIRDWCNNNNPDAPLERRTGLGLLMVLKLTSRMKGRITVSTEQRMGTTIALILPA